MTDRWRRDGHLLTARLTYHGGVTFDLEHPPITSGGCPLTRDRDDTPFSDLCILASWFEAEGATRLHHVSDAGRTIPASPFEIEWRLERDGTPEWRVANRETQDGNR